jgi:ribosomal protein S18 acetylase RimI-like enzyme
MECIMPKNRVVRVASAALLIAVCVFGLWFYSSKSEQGPIVSFNQQRDLKQMVELFEKNRSMLTYQKYSDPAFLFINKTPSYRDPRFVGAMEIKVMRDGDNLIGYTTYYIDEEGKGKILFVVVDEKYRGKRYAQQLVEYALKDFKKWGLKYAYMVTRVDNFPAQKAYLRAGFFETERDDTYVTFGYNL